MNDHTKVAIECNNLTRKFGSVIAVNNISFSVNYGEIFGIMGPNGAGKTTCLRLFSAVLQPDSGNCFIDGLDIKTASVHCKKIVGLLPESSGIYQNLTAKEFLLFIADLYRLDLKKSEQMITDYFKLLNFHDENQMLVNLSRGTRQKVLFIATLLNDPKILLLDEPVATMDPLITVKIKELIKKLVQNQKAIVISSHNSSFLEELCNRVLFISEGRAIALGTVTELKDRFHCNSLETCYLKAMED